MNDITKLTLKQTISGLKAKKFSAVELISAYIKNIEDNRHLNAYITDNFESALQKAKESDQNIAKDPNSLRELEAIPLGIKDMFCTKDLKTTACSKMLADFIPTYESTVTQKLLDAGAIFLGKTNMDEFAMGSATTSGYFGPTINPYRKKDSNEDLVSGGSSGGSAAAVAANLCLAATGTDTGGSIRQPASFTNIVGVKPTYGRCSRYGIISYASSLDQAGMFAKNVSDAAFLMQIISGYDPKDSTSSKVAVPDFSNSLNSNIKGKKIGIPKEYRLSTVPAEIGQLWDKAIDLLKQRGAEIIDISLPHTKYAPSVYYIIAPAECSSNLARYDGIRYGLRIDKDKNGKMLSLEEMYEKTRSEGFGWEVKRRIMVGSYVLSSGYYEAYYKKASKVRRQILQDFRDSFTNVDAILTPVTPSSAFSIKDSSKLDPIQMYLNDIFTIPASLAGMPAMSIPAGFDHNHLPLGIQIIANHFDEQTMFNVALALEESLS